jgi:arylformamidase
LRILDISVPVGPGLPVWPGDPRPQVTPMLRLDAGDPANTSHFSAGVHTGTHVDAPLHFLSGGGTVDTLDLDILVGRAHVADVPPVDRIDSAVLDSLDVPDDVRRLLLRTRNSALWRNGPAFEPDFSALDPDGAEWIVQRDIKLVGIDYLSIQRYDEDGFDTHLVLLRAGVIILEGLRLDHVRPGPYGLVCLPILLAGTEAAPARALLIDEPDGEMA